MVFLKIVHLEKRRPTIEKKQVASVKENFLTDKVFNLCFSH